MFTNIPTGNVIEIINENNVNHFEGKEQLTNLLYMYIKQNYFSFNNKFYVQEGLHMGSTLSPILADTYMNRFGDRIVTTSKHGDKIKAWMRYVNDVLFVWKGNNEQLAELLKEINGMEHKIQFLEDVGRKEINYLDMNIKINEGVFEYDIFRKKTYSDLII